MLLFHTLARYLKTGSAVLRFSGQGPDGTQAALTVEDMAASYLRELRETRTEGPYYLGGHSSGGPVAFEMARRLRAQGHSVTLLALFDTGHPGFDRPRLARLHHHARSLWRLGLLRYAEETLWGVTTACVKTILPVCSTRPART